MEILVESPRFSGRLDLMGLFTGNRKSIDSDESDPSWKCTDYTRGHLLVILISMGATYIIQLVGLIIALASIDPNKISYRVVSLVEPYFEVVEMFIIVFLVHFQFQAFYNEPFRILEIISRKFQYTNITITIVSTCVLISYYTAVGHFTKIFQMLSMIVLMVLVIYAYCQGYLINKNTEYRSLRQIFGFNVLYSISLPLIAIELSETIAISASYHNNLNSSNEGRTCIIISLYFLIGTFAVFFLKDIYMGLALIYNLLGVFILQSQSICKDRKSQCSVAVEVLSLLYAIFIGALLVGVLYWYPKAFLFKFQNRKQLARNK